MDLLFLHLYDILTSTMALLVWVFVMIMSVDYTRDRFVDAAQRILETLASIYCYYYWTHADDEGDRERGERERKVKFGDVHLRFYDVIELPKTKLSHAKLPPIGLDWSHAIEVTKSVDDFMHTNERKTKKQKKSKKRKGLHVTVTLDSPPRETKAQPESMMLSSNRSHSAFLSWRLRRRKAIQSTRLYHAKFIRENSSNRLIPAQ